MSLPITVDEECEVYILMSRVISSYPHGRVMLQTPELNRMNNMVGTLGIQVLKHILGDEFYIIKFLTIFLPLCK